DDSLRVDLGGRRIIKKIFFQAEDGIRDRSVSRGLGDVYKRQAHKWSIDLGFLTFKITLVQASVSYTHLTLPTTPYV
ncbi:hypothetical protein, partial [Staphylococcus aureus]